AAFHNQTGMQDLLAPAGRHVLLRRCAFEWHHRLDLAAEHLGVELECGFAVAVERQIRVQLHDVAPVSDICASENSLCVVILGLVATIVPSAHIGATAGEDGWAKPDHDKPAGNKRAATLGAFPHFSATAFRLARPASKSCPTIR